MSTTEYLSKKFDGQQTYLLEVTLMRHGDHVAIEFIMLIDAECSITLLHP